MLTGSLRLRSPAEVDSLRGVTFVGGALYIGPSTDITDLGALRDLRTVRVGVALEAGNGPCAGATGVVR